VPVKGSDGGKGRLARLLSPAQRAALVRAMLHDVVEALCQANGLGRVAVTSADTELLAFAATLGAVALPEPPGTRGLNAALSAGLTTLASAGAQAVLIVQGDVPEIDPDEVDALLTGLVSPLVRAVPSADGGTSALLLSPPNVLAPAFGPGSFARHAAAASTAGIPFQRYDLPSLARDIDRPEDLARLRTSARAPHTRGAIGNA
jgi:2-phospho-L-lactate guanylyltransferase